MSKKVDTETKKKRLTDLIEDLSVCIAHKRRFPFATKVITHKITWNKKAFALKDVFCDLNIIESHALLSHTYLYTTKGKSLSSEAMVQILLNKIESEMVNLDKENDANKITDLESEEVKNNFIEHHVEMFSPELEEDSGEIETLNFDEIEWGVIKLGLRKVIETEEKYASVATKIIEKIEA